MIMRAALESDADTTQSSSLNAPELGIRNDRTSQSGYDEEVFVQGHAKQRHVPAASQVKAPTKKHAPAFEQRVQTRFLWSSPAGAQVKHQEASENCETAKDDESWFFHGFVVGFFRRLTDLRFTRTNRDALKYSSRAAATQRFVSGATACWAVRSLNSELEARARQTGVAPQLSAGEPSPGSSLSRCGDCNE